MKLDLKFFIFLTTLFFSYNILLSQTNEVKPQTFESKSPKKSLLRPIKESKKLPDYLKKEFFNNMPKVDSKNKYFDQPEIKMSNQETFLDPGKYYLNKRKSP